MVKYTRHAPDADKSAYSRGDDLGIHFKNTFETADAIKGMALEEVKDFLSDVIDHKRCVPFRRYNGGVGRCHQAKEWGVSQGRWPVKSCKAVLGLVENAEANAKAKGLDSERLYVWHVAVKQAPKGRRRLYRAHGRINQFMSNPCHVEVILRERKDDVPNAPADADHKIVKLGKNKV